MKRLMSVLCCLGMLSACGGGSSDGDVVQDASGAPAEAAATPDLTDEAADSPDVSATADAPVVDEPAAEASIDLGDVEAGPPVDACALLTAAEVEAVVGGPSSAEPEDFAPLFFGCSWSVPSGFLSVDVISHGDSDAARASFDFFLGEVTEVDGIGDAALYNILLDLAFISDGYEVSINMVGDFDDDTARAHAQDLARLIIPRLP